MTYDLELRQLERKIMELEVSKILTELATEVVAGISKGKCVDTDIYTRKIIAHLREHLID